MNEHKNAYNKCVKARKDYEESRRIEDYDAQIKVEEEFEIVDKKRYQNSKRRAFLRRMYSYEEYKKIVKSENIG